MYFELKPKQYRGSPKKSPWAGYFFAMLASAEKSGDKPPPPTVLYSIKIIFFFFEKRREMRLGFFFLGQPQLKVMEKNPAPRGFLGEAHENRRNFQSILIVLKLEFRTRVNLAGQLKVGQHLNQYRENHEQSSYEMIYARFQKCFSKILQSIIKEEQRRLGSRFIIGVSQQFILDTLSNIYLTSLTKLPTKYNILKPFLDEKSSFDPLKA